MMKVIYTETPGKDLGTCYRLPEPFFGVISTATDVVLEGDFPDIESAYKAEGIKVKKTDTKKPVKAQDDKEPTL